MEVLVGNLLVCCLLLFVFSILQKKYKYQYSDVGLFVLAISFIQVVFVHAAVDVNSVPDLPDYQLEYSATKLSIQQMLTEFRTNEFIFYLSYRFTQILSNEFGFYLLIYSIFIIAVYYLTFYKYSYNFLLSVVLLLMLPYAQSVYVLRQHLAIAICLLSLPLIFDRKMMGFLIVCTIAFFIHHSAIVWVPVYFLYNIKSRFSIVAVSIMIAVGAAVLSTNILMINDLLEFDYEVYLVEKDTSYTKSIISVIYFVSYLFFCRKHLFEDGIYRFTTMVLFLCTLGYLVNAGISLLGRLLLYYEIFLTISIPLTVKNIKNEFIKIAFTTSVIVLQGYATLSLYRSEFFRELSLTSMPFHYFLVIVFSSILLVRLIKNNNNLGSIINVKQNV